MEKVSIILRPVGYVRIKYSDEEVKKSCKGVEGVIEILDEYKDGLYKLDGFSHLIIIAYLHKSRGKPLIIKPRGLLRRGFTLNELPEIGVFASDSPNRPNPIALTIVEVIDLKNNKIYVKGLDLFDGTPILDIKPYTPDRRIEELKVPDWYVKLINKAIKKGYKVSHI